MKMETSLPYVEFSTENILKATNNLCSSKGHSHNEISIRLLKIRVSSIYIPLEVTCKSCLEKAKFQKEQLVEMYRARSLLPIIGKIF